MAIGQVVNDASGREYVVVQVSDATADVSSIDGIQKIRNNTGVPRHITKESVRIRRTGKQVFLKFNNFIHHGTKYQIQ